MATLPELREDFPLGLAPISHRVVSRNDNDRLAILGKYVLEMVTAHELFLRHPYLSGEAIEVRICYAFVRPVDLTVFPLPAP